MVKSMHRLAQCWAAVFAVGQLLMVNATAAPGSFSVTSGGSTNYTVPIQAPPGVAGIVPRLALTYSSSANSGVAGVGWSLSGSSYLTRCGRAFEHDQEVEGVSLTDSDKLCLDGVRLLLIAGNYGMAGSEYRLAKDPYARIKAVAPASGAVPYFTVSNKDGSVLTYGNTDDSVVKMSVTGGTVVFMRGLAERKSATNQLIKFSYSREPGGLLLSKVEYAPSMSVKLTYESRQDESTVYLGVNPIRSGMRLSEIAAQSNGVVVGRYNLKYTTGESGKSLLSKLSHCSATSCAPDLIFDYNKPNTGDAVNLALSGHGVGSIGWGVADIFGDGTEVYWTANKDGAHFATQFLRNGSITNWSWSGQHGLGSGGWQLANLFGGNQKVYWSREGSTHYITQLNKNGSAKSWTYSNGHNLGDGGWGIVDLFGDGRPVYWTRTGSTHYATRFNPNGTLQNWTWPGNVLGSDGRKFINAFGDGRAIYWTRQGGTHYLTQLNADGTSQNWTVQGSGAGEVNDFGDLFGEGRDVYWARDGGTHFATRFNRDGTAQSYSWSGQGVAADGSRLVDIFGDGRKVFWTRGGAKHFVSRFNPDSTVNNFSFDGQEQASHGWDFVDWFGDGRMMYWTWGSDGIHRATRFFADGTSKSYQWNGRGQSADGWRIVDFFGTGTKSYWTHAGSNHYITIPNFDPPDILRSALTSGGDEIQVEYASLAEMENIHKQFSRTNPTEYPVVNQGSKTQVVRSSLHKAAGVPGKQLLYAYANHLFEGGRQGRGSLGFEWTQVKDMSTGLVGRTYYRQDFPLLGQVAKVGQGTSEAAWSNLALTTFSYTFRSFSSTDSYYAEPVNCADDATTSRPLKSCTDIAVKPGNRYVAYIHEKLEKNWDWNDQTNEFIAMPQVHTTIVEDKFGNVENITENTLTPDGAPTPYKKITDTFFSSPDTANWMFGRAIKVQVTKVAPK